MNILGIGTDLVAKKRIALLLEKFSERFIQRILSEDEHREFNARGKTIDYIAKRFAGKEAIAKALGTGIGEKVSFHEISIVNLSSGKPQATLLGKASQLIKEFNIQTIHISLSDEKDVALAFAVIEKTLQN